MSLADDLARQTPPAGHQPGVDYDGRDRAAVRSKAMDVPPHELRDEDLLKAHGFDPAHWRIAGNIKARMWDGPVSAGTVVTYYWYAFDVARRTDLFDTQPMADLVDHIRSWTRAVPPPPTSGGWMIACIGDTQFGKADGDGTDGTIGRFRRYVADVAGIERERRGHDQLFVASLGDLIEHCSGFYADQLATIDRTLTEQLMLAVELFTAAIRQWRDVFTSIHVGVVPGNHGQTLRRGGKQVTPARDNFDLLVWQLVRHALETAGIDDVQWTFPDDASQSLAVTLDDVEVGLVHGHQWKRPAAAYDWWKGQMAGRQPVANADLLLSGHWHHELIHRKYKRAHWQIPAMDGGSEWVQHTLGFDSPPGGLVGSVHNGKAMRPCVI